VTVRDICYSNVSFPLKAQQVRLNEKKTLVSFSFMVHSLLFMSA